MKTLTTIFLCLFSGLLYSQIITVLPTDNEFHNDNMDISSPWSEWTLYLNIQNETADTLYLKWELEIFDGCQEEWGLRICDKNQHYTFEVTSNVQPSVGLDQPLQMLPNEFDEIFMLHFLPFSTPGCCQADVHFSLVDDPDNILQTAHFDFQVNAPDCFPLSVNGGETAFFRIYPNPSNGRVTIESTMPFENIEVFNSTGQFIEKYKSASIYFDMNNYSPGLYFLKINYSDGRSEWARIEKFNY